MPWFKVDDKLHDHRKVRKAGKAAMGVWVLAGSWSADNETDGFIPADVMSRWGTRADAARLVAAGLWFVDSSDCENGWRFHDWTHFQPSAAVTSAKRAAEHEAGIRGNHNRWHVKRQVSDPDCEYCHRVPDHEPDGVPDQVDMGVPESAPNPPRGESAPIPPVPVPVPNKTVGSNEPTLSVRADVERICEHLAAAVAANGSKRPAITARWRDAARLLLDKDERTETQVTAAIDWCQHGDSKAALFWRPNVMSLPKLREKYDQMRLQADAEQRGSQPPQTRVQEHLALVQQLAEAESQTTQAQIGQRR